MTEPHTVYPRHLPRNFNVIFPISSICEYVENLLTFYNSLTIFFCFSVQATTCIILPIHYFKIIYHCSFAFQMSNAFQDNLFWSV